MNRRTAGGQRDAPRLARGDQPRPRRDGQHAGTAASAERPAAKDGAAQGRIIAPLESHYRRSLLDEAVEAAVFPVGDVAGIGEQPRHAHALEKLAERGESLARRRSVSEEGDDRIDRDTG
jgi:hypothetical protein